MVQDYLYEAIIRKFFPIYVKIAKRDPDSPWVLLFAEIIKQPVSEKDVRDVKTALKKKTAMA